MTKRTSDARRRSVRPTKIGGWVLATILGLGAQLSHGAGCVVENDRIEVIGELSRQTFAGPPNYESVHRGDRAETYWILTTRYPIDFCRVADANGTPHTVGSVNRFQLVLSDDQRGVMQALIARYAVVRGRIFLGHGERHHAAALIEVVEILPSARAFH